MWGLELVAVKVVTVQLSGLRLFARTAVPKRLRACEALVFVRSFV